MSDLSQALPSGAQYIAIDSYTKYNSVVARVILGIVSNWLVLLIPLAVLIILKLVFGKRINKKMWTFIILGIFFFEIILVAFAYINAPNSTSCSVIGPAGDLSTYLVCNKII